MSYASTIVGNHFYGYVQMLCHTPLLINLYREQILLLKYLGKECLTLHFDGHNWPFLHSHCHVGLKFQGLKIDDLVDSFEKFKSLI